MNNKTLNISKFIISEYDTRKYKYIKLDNELDVILISDPNTIVSAASLVVGVGSIHNKDILGISHFLEHMLFMGSKKYPGEEDYFKFITNNGGNSNAYTSYDHTCYYFSIQPNKLKQGLDIFANFFITPLLSKDGITREMNAVNSEHEKNINNDSARIYEISKKFYNSETPFSKFHTGTLETLNIDNIHNKIKDFYETEYSANRMKLVILGVESLLELEEYAKKIFVKIPNKKLNINNNTDDNLLLTKSNQIIKISPITNTNRLIISWVLKNHKKFIYYKPYILLQFLFESRAQGSLYDILSHYGWLEELSIDIDIELPKETIIELILILTEEGIENVKKIIKIIFKYIDFLINSDIPKYIYNEFIQMNKLQFKYKNKEDPISYVSDITWRMFILNIPINQIFVFYSLYPKFSNAVTTILKYYMKEMSIEKSNIILVSQLYKDEIENNKTGEEYYYKIKYKLEDNILNFILNCDKLSSNIQFKFQNKNIFIPYNFTIDVKNQIKGVYKLNIKNPLIEGWYSPDVKFLLPKVSIICVYTIPNILTELENYVRMVLFINTFNITNSNLLNMLEIAGYRISLIINNRKLQLYIYGYSKNIKKILILILNKIAKATLDKKKFIIEKEILKRECVNYKLLQPSQLVFKFLKKKINTQFFNELDILSVIDSITYEDTTTILSKITKACVLTYVYGNIKENNAKKIINLSGHLINNKKVYVYQKKDIDIIKQKPIKIINSSKNENDKNSACLLICNIGYIKDNVTKYWAEKQCYLDILDMMISKDFFHQLRTVDQLGYIVKSNNITFGDSLLPVYGFSFLVQSSHTDSQFLLDRILTFIKDYGKTIQQNSKEFELSRKTLIEEYSKTFQTPGEELSYNFSIIKQKTNLFNKKQLLLKTIQEITFENYINFYLFYFINNKKLWISQINSIKKK
jgi:insulysin